MAPLLRAAGFALLAAAGTVRAMPAAPTPPASVPVDPEETRMDAAVALMREKKPAEAVALLDQVITAEDRAHATERSAVYSSRSQTETMMYLMGGTQEKRDTVVLGPTWSLAVFLKGFALIDLGRADEAEPYLVRAVTLAPMNAQFLNELAEYRKNRGQPDAAYALFARARDAADYSPGDVRGSDRRRAWRGMAFILSDRGKFDEATALYRKCLAEDPADAHARAELDWIAKQRRQR